MMSRLMFSVAAIVMGAAPSSVAAADCGPGGCGSAACAPCAASSCGSCSTSCPIAGDQPCCCCSDVYGDGIDVDSLTTEAQSKQLYEAMQARLVFELPEDAGIQLSGQRMGTPGAKRTFIVPVLHQKKVFKYEIKVDVVRGGKKYFKKSTIEILRAGAILAIKVEAPPVADGEPAQIKVEVAPVAPGGPPDEDEATAMLLR